MKTKDKEALEVYTHHIGSKEMLGGTAHVQYIKLLTWLWGNFSGSNLTLAYSLTAKETEGTVPGLWKLWSEARTDKYCP